MGGSNRDGGEEEGEGGEETHVCGCFVAVLGRGFCSNRRSSQEGVSFA